MDRPLFIAGQRREKQPDGWGTPMPLLHRSITEIKEQEFVATLVSNSRHRDMLFNLKGLDGDTSRILQGVELRQFRPELQGDVDILLAPHGAPERSTAIQVKRLHVKVGLDEADAGQKQRMSQLVAKGVR